MGDINSVRTYVQIEMDNIYLDPSSGQIDFDVPLDKVKPGTVEHTCLDRKSCPLAPYCKTEEGARTAEFSLEREITLTDENGNCQIPGNSLASMVQVARECAPSTNKNSHAVNLAQTLTYKLSSSIIG